MKTTTTTRHTIIWFAWVVVVCVRLDSLVIIVATDTTLARTYEVEHGVQLVSLSVYVQRVDYTNSTVQVRCGRGDT